MKNLIWITMLLSLTILSCDSDEDNDNTSSDLLEDIYTKSQLLKLEVAYEENAEPYIEIGGLLGSNNVWSFTDMNIEALIAGRQNPNNFETDRILSEMVMIPTQNKNTYTQNELIDLAENYITTGVNGNTGTIALLFVDGLLDNGNGAEQNVLGISLGKTGITIIFKPVINNINTSNDNKAGIEQATVVHEIGHALGLVNNGVDMVNNHQDDQNGKHCTNQDCVMYWTNTGAGGITSFVNSGLFSMNNVVFGQECLTDVQAFNP